LTLGQLYAFEVSGDSMAPTLDAQDIIVARKVEDFTKLINGVIYVIATSTGLFIKRIEVCDDTLILTPDNPMHDAFNVLIKDVKFVWRAERRITTINA